MLTATADGRFCRVDGQVILSTRRRTRRAALRRVALHRVAKMRALDYPRRETLDLAPVIPCVIAVLVLCHIPARSHPAALRLCRAAFRPIDPAGTKQIFRAPLSSIRRMKLPGIAVVVSRTYDPCADVFTRRRTQNDSKCSRFECVRLACIIRTMLHYLR